MQLMDQAGAGVNIYFHYYNLEDLYYFVGFPHVIFLL